MAAGHLRSFRVGPKLWRTTRENIEAYKSRQFERYRRPVMEMN